MAEAGFGNIVFRDETNEFLAVILRRTSVAATGEEDENLAAVLKFYDDVKLLVTRGILSFYRMTAKLIREVDMPESSDEEETALGTEAVSGPDASLPPETRHEKQVVSLEEDAPKVETAPKLQTPSGVEVIPPSGTGDATRPGQEEKDQQGGRGASLAVGEITHESEVASTRGDVSEAAPALGSAPAPETAPQPETAAEQETSPQPETAAAPATAPEFETPPEFETASELEPETNIRLPEAVSETAAEPETSSAPATAPEFENSFQFETASEIEPEPEIIIRLPKAVPETAAPVPVITISPAPDLEESAPVFEERALDPERLSPPSLYQWYQVLETTTDTLDLDPEESASVFEERASEPEEPVPFMTTALTPIPEEAGPVFEERTPEPGRLSPPSLYYPVPETTTGTLDPDSETSAPASGGPAPEPEEPVPVITITEAPDTEESAPASEEPAPEPVESVLDPTGTSAPDPETPAPEAGMPEAEPGAPAPESGPAPWMTRWPSIPEPQPAIVSRDFEAESILADTLSAMGQDLVKMKWQLARMNMWMTQYKKGQQTSPPAAVPLELRAQVALAAEGVMTRAANLYLELRSLRTLRFSDDAGLWVEREDEATALVLEMKPAPMEPAVVLTVVPEDVELDVPAMAEPGRYYSRHRFGEEGEPVGNGDAGTSHS